MAAHINFFVVIHISIWNGSSLEISYMFIICKLLEDTDIIYLIMPSHKLNELNGQKFSSKPDKFLFHCK